MGDKSAIEWTDSTWNPIIVAPEQREVYGRWFCERVSPGCAHCYASRLNVRYGGWKYPGLGALDDYPKMVLDERMLMQPLRWQKPRRIFVCSMTDLFGEWVPDEWIDRMFAVMALCPQHTFQVLTKRPKRMRDYLNRGPFEAAVHGSKMAISDPRLAKQLAASIRTAAAASEDPEWYVDNGEYAARWPLPNVWLGVSAEYQRQADERIPFLLEMPAAVRFVSAEPLLGPIDLTQIVPPAVRKSLVPEDSIPSINALTGLIAGPDEYLPGRAHLDWVITGGESGGPEARRLVERCGHCNPQYGNNHVRIYGHKGPCCVCGGSGWAPKPDALAWVRSIRDQCNAAGVSYLHKQWGGATPKSGGRELDGRTWDEYPQTRQAVPA